MKYYDRRSQSFKEENEQGKKALEFLYHTVLGRMILKVISLPFFSNAARLYKNTRLSKGTIKSFAEKNGIEVSQQELKSFGSFNEFFIRRRDVEICEGSEVLISPADSKLSVFKVDDNLRLAIKNTTYSLSELLGDEELAKRFSGCMCLVFRLAVDDMHHYYFVDDGEIISNKKIKGQLHTVRAISEEYGVFTRNKREVTVMKTSNFGYVAQIEIGALLVGRIVNSSVSSFKKGEEKGYFEFGGSTVVLLLEKTPILDSDIKKANDEGYETKVCAGEKIGTL